MDTGSTNVFETTYTGCVLWCVIILMGISLLTSLICFPLYSRASRVSGPLYSSPHLIDSYIPIDRLHRVSSFMYSTARSCIALLVKSNHDEGFFRCREGSLLFS